MNTEQSSTECLIIIKNEMNKKVVFVTISILVFGYLLFSGYKLGKNILHNLNTPVETVDKPYSYRAEVFFEDPKVVDFCKSIEKGDFQKADELLKEGVNINTVGKDGMIPFLWSTDYALFKTKELEKQAFQYFLKKRANPLKLYNIDHKEGQYTTVLHYVSRLEDPWYLKELLESKLIKKEDIDFRLPGKGNITAILLANANDRFTNFKMLLDYGADINWRRSEKGDTLLSNCVGNMSWRFAYELLKRGVDFNIDSLNGQSDVQIAAEELSFWPSVSLNYKGKDYRQKCVNFLRKKGIEVNPWMPKNEKYIKENGKDVLYVNEGINWLGERVPNKEDKWIKFEESSMYDPEFKKRDANDKYTEKYKDLQQPEIDYSFKKSFPDKE